MLKLWLTIAVLCLVGCTDVKGMRKMQDGCVAAHNGCVTATTGLQGEALQSALGACSSGHQSCMRTAEYRHTRSCDNPIIDKE